MPPGTGSEEMEVINQLRGTSHCKNDTIHVVNPREKEQSSKDEKFPHLRTSRDFVVGGNSQKTNVNGRNTINQTTCESVHFSSRNRIGRPYFVRFYSNRFSGLAATDASFVLSSCIVPSRIAASRVFVRSSRIQPFGRHGWHSRNDGIGGIIDSQFDARSDSRCRANSITSNAFAVAATDWESFPRQAATFVLLDVRAPSDVFTG